MSKLNLRPDLPLSAVASIAEEAAAAGWTDVLPMAGGEPRFAPPPAALSALSSASVEAVTKYTPFRGTVPLLAGIQRKLSEVNDLSVDLSEIIALPGGAQALFSALSVLIGPDRREVVLIDPCWEHYPRIAQAAGAEVRIVPTVREGAHDRIDLDALRGAVTSRTAAVLLNTPLNPTGSVLTAAELREIGDVCGAARARLVVDEEYETFVYGPHQHVSARSVVPEAISLFSFSKSFALTGIRLGYICADPETVDAIKRFGLYTYMYSASPSMVMAAEMLRDDVRPYLKNARGEYEAKAADLSANLDALPGVSCVMPEGGVYVFPRIAQEEGSSVAMRLVRERHLLCVPGEAAGATGRGHVRLFIGLDDAQNREAVLRVREFVEADAE
ncbi:pyridoxal phosphate-dependent aminotransferase [Micromonospora sp. DT4]|uniref:pyridoxal phosphate-dependent aminotransferase n=1 Tax=Micromonospora sp. DT4 TaxID=3393438 RepID=UPI003CF54E9C